METLVDRPYWIDFNSHVSPEAGGGMVADIRLGDVRPGDGPPPLGAINDRPFLKLPAGTVRYNGRVGETTDGRLTLSFTYRPEGWTATDDRPAADFSTVIV